MSTITIFDNEAAELGDHSAHAEAVAVIECDDTYNNRFLSVVGLADLKALLRKAKKWQYFHDVTFI